MTGRIQRTAGRAHQHQLGIFLNSLSHLRAFWCVSLVPGHVPLQECFGMLRQHVDSDDMNSLRFHAVGFRLADGTPSLQHFASFRS